LGVLLRLLGRSQPIAVAPWTDDSIFRTISTLVDPASGKLARGDLPRLDEESQNDGGRIRWAPGALDGVFGHHGSRIENDTEVRKFAKLVDRVARSGDRGAIAEAYALLKNASVLALVDPVLQLLSEWRTPSNPHLAQFAFQLATQSRDRGPVKAGIALIGAMKLAEHQEVVITLGKHDEFTLFAAVALKNIFDDPTVPLWQLARYVDGWGRIQTVERLVPTNSAEIQQWLRTEGYKNSIMYEYLALTAAIHGHLREALERNAVPDEELVAAGEIIVAMIASDGGPGPGMNAYSDAAATCLAYLAHVSSAPPELGHLLAAGSILRYLSDDSRDVAERLKTGWSESAVANVLAQAKRLISRPGWVSLVQFHLESDEDHNYYRATQAAQEIGLDPFEWHWRRLQARRLDSSAWHMTMQSASADRIDQILDFAEIAIPLAEIATGPGNELGLGKEFEAHSCLDYVLQGLRRFPGKGSSLVVAGLRSPVVRNRNLALNALEKWERPFRDPTIVDVLTRASREEVDKEVAARIVVLLGGS
jgi:hypothetical protein